MNEDASSPSPSSSPPPPPAREPRFPWVKPTLCIIFLLAVLGWAVVRHTVREVSMRRSDGGIAIVRLHGFYWTRVSILERFSVGGSQIMTLLSITDDQGTIREWRAGRDRYEQPVLIRDLRGGYCVAMRHGYPTPVIYGYWLGRQGERVVGFPADLPLNRCVQNYDLNISILRRFDPEDRNTRVSSTVFLWWKIRRGRDVDEVPPDFIKEILDTEFGGARDLTPFIAP